MAQKRMFTMKIVDSDAFLDMPLSTQCLYFHLNMRADDDGFIGNTKRIMRMIGASEDDLKILLAKRFIIMFEDNVVVIKHWWLHNTLIKDRYHETTYTDEKAQLFIKENKAYTLNQNEALKICNQSNTKMLTECIQEVNSDLGLNLDKGLDKDLNLNTNTKAELTPLILNDHTEWLPTKKEYDEYKQLYPNVDIDMQFKKMRGWLNGNPTKRKTKKGIARFVNNWLSNEQDKPKQFQPSQKQNFNNSNFDDKLDMVAMWQQGANSGNN